MNTYEYIVTLGVQIESYDEEDAEDMLQDTFGLGEDCGVTIKSLNIEAIE